MPSTETAIRAYCFHDCVGNPLSPANSIERSNHSPRLSIKCIALERGGKIIGCVVRRLNVFGFILLENEAGRVTSKGPHGTKSCVHLWIVVQRQRFHHERWQFGGVKIGSRETSTFPVRSEYNQCKLRGGLCSDKFSCFHDSDSRTNPSVKQRERMTIWNRSRVALACSASRWYGTTPAW